MADIKQLFKIPQYPYDGDTFAICIIPNEEGVYGEEETSFAINNDQPPGVKTKVFYNSVLWEPGSIIQLILRGHCSKRVEQYFTYVKDIDTWVCFWQIIPGQQDMVKIRIVYVNQIDAPVSPYHYGGHYYGYYNYNHNNNNYNYGGSGNMGFNDYPTCPYEEFTVKRDSHFNKRLTFEHIFNKLEYDINYHVASRDSLDYHHDKVITPYNAFNAGGYSFFAKFDGIPTGNDTILHGEMEVYEYYQLYCKSTNNYDGLPNGDLLRVTFILDNEAMDANNIYNDRYHYSYEGYEYTNNLDYYENYQLTEDIHNIKDFIFRSVVDAYIYTYVAIAGMLYYMETNYNYTEVVNAQHQRGLIYLYIPKEYERNTWSEFDKTTNNPYFPHITDRYLYNYFTDNVQIPWTNHVSYKGPYYNVVMGLTLEIDYAEDSLYNLSGRTTLKHSDFNSISDKDFDNRINILEVTFSLYQKLLQDDDYLLDTNTIKQLPVWSSEYGIYYQDEPSGSYPRSELESWNNDILNNYYPNVGSYTPLYASGGLSIDFYYAPLLDREKTNIRDLYINISGSGQAYLSYTKLSDSYNKIKLVDDVRSSLLVPFMSTDEIQYNEFPEVIKRIHGEITTDINIRLGGRYTAVETFPYFNSSIAFTDSNFSIKHYQMADTLSKIMSYKSRLNYTYTINGKPYDDVFYHKTQYSFPHVIKVEVYDQTAKPSEYREVRISKRKTVAISQGFDDDYYNFIANNINSTFITDKDFIQEALAINDNLSIMSYSSTSYSLYYPQYDTKKRIIYDFVQYAKENYQPLINWVMSFRFNETYSIRYEDFLDYCLYKFAPKEDNDYVTNHIRTMSRHPRYPRSVTYTKVFRYNHKAYSWSSTKKANYERVNNYQNCERYYLSKKQYYTNDPISDGAEIDHSRAVIKQLYDTFNAKAATLKTDYAPSIRLEGILNYPLTSNHILTQNKVDVPFQNLHYTKNFRTVYDSNTSYSYPFYYFLPPTITKQNIKLHKITFSDSYVRDSTYQNNMAMRNNNDDQRFMAWYSSGKTNYSLYTYYKYEVEEYNGDIVTPYKWYWSLLHERQNYNVTVEDVAECSDQIKYFIENEEVVFDFIAKDDAVIYVFFTREIKGHYIEPK